MAPGHGLPRRRPDRARDRRAVPRAADRAAGAVRGAPAGGRVRGQRAVHRAAHRLAAAGPMARRHRHRRPRWAGPRVDHGAAGVDGARRRQERDVAQARGRRPGPQRPRDHGRQRAQLRDHRGRARPPAAGRRPLRRGGGTRACACPRTGRRARRRADHHVQRHGRGRGGRVGHACRGRATAADPGGRRELGDRGPVRHRPAGRRDGARAASPATDPAARRPRQPAGRAAGASVRPRRDGPVRRARRGDGDRAAAAGS